jgi:hypothetical protein
MLFVDDPLDPVTVGTQQLVFLEKFWVVEHIEVLIAASFPCVRFTPAVYVVYLKAANVGTASAPIGINPLAVRTLTFPS